MRHGSVSANEFVDDEDAEYSEHGVVVHENGYDEEEQDEEDERIFSDRREHFRERERENQEEDHGEEEDDFWHFDVLEIEAAVDIQEIHEEGPGKGKGKRRWLKPVFFVEIKSNAL